MGQKSSTPAEVPLASAVVNTSHADTPQPSSSAASLPKNLSPAERQSITAVVNRSNPSPDDSQSHNHGQPVSRTVNEGNAAAAAGTASGTASGGSGGERAGASKFKTDCRDEHRASLKCIEDNYVNKDAACQDYFATYKRCRFEERERKLAENARKTGGQRHGFW